MTSRHRRSSGAAGTALGLAGILLWLYGYVANHTTGRTRDVSLRFIRIGLYSLYAFMICVLIVSVCAIFLPWLLEAILTSVMNYFGVTTKEFIGLMFNAMVLISLIAGAIMESGKTTQGEGYFTGSATPDAVVQPVAGQSPSQNFSPAYDTSGYTSIDSNTERCTNCGYPLTDTYKLCPNCGTRVK